MSAAGHVFPPEQAAFLRARARGGYRAGERSARLPAHVSLVAQMPPVYSQALRTTCVANAVVALLEYFVDCKLRFSVQFLHEATKCVERDGLERNLAALEKGAAPDAPFEAAFHAQLLQLKMLADANGADSAAFKGFLRTFAEGARTRWRTGEGALLCSCFRALETYGICRHALWPYAGNVAAPLFGGGDAAPAFPPGALEDARKRRIAAGLYLLRAPNNVEEIRALLAGANGRRPMPVCVTLDLFEGCDGTTFTFPETRETDDGALAAVPARKGKHGVLLVGYANDPAKEGGGEFIVRNSWGGDWGDAGHGRVSYAYVECFATEAGTLLQDRVDYEGDGYDGLRKVKDAAARGRRRWKMWLVNLLVALGIAAATVLLGVLLHDPLHVAH